MAACYFSRTYRPRTEPDVTRLLLARHGATTFAADRFAGSTDVPLSDEGKAQARHLARRLRRTDRGRLLQSIEPHGDDRLDCCRTARLVADRP